MEKTGVGGATFNGLDGGRDRKVADRLGPPPPLMNVDRAVAAECEARGVAVRDDVEERIDLHLALLHRWVDGADATPRR